MSVVGIMMNRFPTLVSDGERSFKASAMFFGVHCALAVVLVHIAPTTTSGLPGELLVWGGVLEHIVPSIHHLSSLTEFPGEAWFASVVMWSLLPLAIVFAACLRWLWVPNETNIRRHPWLLLFAVALFGMLIVWLMRYSPTEVRGYGVGARKLEIMISSRVAYGIVLGLMVGATAFCIGLIPRIVMVARLVTKDEFRNKGA